MMKINELEEKFKAISGIYVDLNQFPLKKSPNQERREEFEKFGEVFTPIHIVDRMILRNKPKPDGYNLDLCCGQGQYTIRILRYFVNNYPDFNIDNYLQNNHWFSEINPENIKSIFNIFGREINICMGDSTKLNLMEDDKDTGKWKGGIWFFSSHKNEWVQKERDKNLINIRVKQNSLI